MSEKKDNRKNEPLALPYRGAGRPQIVLIGNGLERKDDEKATKSGVTEEANCAAEAEKAGETGKTVEAGCAAETGNALEAGCAAGAGAVTAGCAADAGNAAEANGVKSKGKSWAELLKDLTVADHLEFGEDDLANVPFPLKYHLLSTSMGASYPMGSEDRKAEEKRLANAVSGIGTVSTGALKRLPKLHADHYFTTNYTYSLEYAFDPNLDFLKEETRSQARFNYNPGFTEKGNQRLEKRYRLYTGYLAKLRGGGQAGLWHIHGECAVPGSIILGHDGYGRLLSRIVPVCGDGRKYHDLKPGAPYGFRSWPELFLFADVYIVGLGLGVSEFDLWWLLRRKQREENADGRVYFYTNDAGKAEFRDRDLMLRALGVIVNPDRIKQRKSHEEFYKAALNNIQKRIKANLEAR